MSTEDGSKRREMWTVGGPEQLFCYWRGRPDGNGVAVTLKCIGRRFPKGNQGIKSGGGIAGKAERR